MRPYSRYTSSEEIEIASVEIAESPRRHETILPKFDLLLPKFHFILPKLYFGSPWRIFVCSLEIPDFLPRGEMRGGRCERTGVPLQVATREICSTRNERYLKSCLYICHYY